jgi:hypothetical protein
LGFEDESFFYWLSKIDISDRSRYIHFASQKHVLFTFIGSTFKWMFSIWKTITVSIIFFLKGIGIQRQKCLIWSEAESPFTRTMKINSFFFQLNWYSFGLLSRETFSVYVCVCVRLCVCVCVFSNTNYPIRFFFPISLSIMHRKCQPEEDLNMEKKIDHQNKYCFSLKCY